MAFNQKYSSIPMALASENIGMPDVPIVFPDNAYILQTFQGSTGSVREIKKGNVIGGTRFPSSSYSFTPMPTDLIRIECAIDGGGWISSLPFIVEPSIYPKNEWCYIKAYDTTRYNYSTYPIHVYFKAFQRKVETRNVVVKYDDNVGTIVPLSQKQYQVITFTTRPLNADVARLLLDVAEWDTLRFYFNKGGNTWSFYNVLKTAEEWQKTTYPKTLGTTIQGSFVIKQ